VSKEAYAPPALAAILAQLRPVPAWMKPVLKDGVTVLAAFTTGARLVLLHLWARDSKVLVHARVTPARFLSGMCKAACGPVMDLALGTREHLVAVHPKLIRLK